MFQTGLAAFGGGHYGILTVEDLALLLVWAISYGMKDGASHAKRIRKIVRQIAPMLKPADLIMLADLCEASPASDENWSLLAEELKAKANKPLFNQ